MADAYMVIGGSNEANDVKEKVNQVYSNVTVKGNNFGEFNYDDSLFGGYPDVGSPPIAPQSTGGTGLLQNMKNNSDTVAKSMNNVAEVLHTGNMVSQKNVNAINNMASSLTSAMSLLANILSVGNGHKEISNRLNNYHNNVQSQKNFLEIDKLEFESKPHSTLVDLNGNPLIPREERVKKDLNNNEYHEFNKNGSENLKDTQNNQIVPRESKATYHAEKAQDEIRMNNYDWNTHLDSVTTAQDEITNEGLSLLENIINMHKLNPESIKKIDDEVQNINIGDTNG